MYFILEIYIYIIFILFRMNECWFLYFDVIVRFTKIYIDDLIWLFILYF